MKLRDTNVERKYQLFQIAKASIRELLNTSECNNLVERAFDLTVVLGIRTSSQIATT
jgi:hypothetical protein